MASISKADLEEVVKTLFTQLDTDGSGFLEREEVKTIANQLNSKMQQGDFDEAAFNEAFTRLDKNGDGKIAQEELLSFFMKAAEKRGLLAE